MTSAGSRTWPALDGARGEGDPAGPADPWRCARGWRPRRRAPPSCRCRVRRRWPWVSSRVLWAAEGSPLEHFGAGPGRLAGPRVPAASSSRGRVPMRCRDPPTATPTPAPTGCCTPARARRATRRQRPAPAAGCGRQDPRRRSARGREDLARWTPPRSARWSPASMTTAQARLRRAPRGRLRPRRRRARPLPRQRLPHPRRRRVRACAGSATPRSRWTSSTMPRPCTTSPCARAAWCSSPARPARASRRRWPRWST